MKVKYTMDQILKQYFQFTTFIEALKKIERFKDQFYWKDYPILNRYESVADHTWRLGMLVVLFENQLKKKIDLAKALKMALIHDLPEIIAGDASALGSDGTGKNSHAYNKDIAAKRKLSEHEAAKTLFGMLPKDLAQELTDLWLEFEMQKSYESKTVKALDRIECMLQVLEYRNGNMFPDHLEFTTNYGLENSDFDPKIKEFSEVIADELRTKFKEYKSN